MSNVQSVLLKVFDVLSREKNSIAENTSSYSDLLYWKIHPEFLKSARKVRLSVVTISFLGLNPDQELSLRTQLLKIAHKYNYQGEWSRVRDLLTLPIFSPHKVLEEHLKDRGLHDFFGNDLRTIKRIWNTLRTYNPYIPKETPVKYPVRKRGYDDKGSLRTSSLLPEHYQRPEKEKIETIEPTNTLFWEEIPYGSQNNKAQETLVVNRTFGGDYDETKPMATPVSTNRRQNAETGNSERVPEIFDIAVKYSGWIEEFRQLILEEIVEIQLETKVIKTFKSFRTSVLRDVLDFILETPEEDRAPVLKYLIRDHYFNEHLSNIPESTD